MGMFGLEDRENSTLALLDTPRKFVAYMVIVYSTPILKYSAADRYTLWVRD